MSQIIAFWDDSFLAHEPPAGEFEAAWTGRLAVEEPHPDKAARVENIQHILRHEFDDYVRWEPAPAATHEQLERVHNPSYIASFESFCREGGGRLTAETGANEHSFEAARHAAGGAIAAVECAVDTERDGIPYACVRPSGHHAQPAQADGFCFFNNVAVAAEYALATDAVDSVAVVDWDVHHGNGTQECFYDRDDVLFISLHNDHWSWDRDAHPQTGDLDESGVGDGAGYNLNVPLPPGTGDEGYAAAFDRVVDPIVEEFDPDLILVSAGQDPGTVDPLGRNVVTKEGFRTLGERARALATAVDAPFAFVQEGGYQVSHLPYATLGVLEGAVGVRTGIEDPFAWLDEDADSARRRLDAVVEHASAWWDV